MYFCEVNLNNDIINKLIEFSISSFKKYALAKFEIMYEFLVKSTAIFKVLIASLYWDWDIKSIPSKFKILQSFGFISNNFK